MKWGKVIMSLAQTFIKPRIDLHNYKIPLPEHKHALLLLDSNSKLFGGPGTNRYALKKDSLELQIGHFSGEYFLFK